MSQSHIFVHLTFNSMSIKYMLRHQQIIFSLRYVLYEDPRTVQIQKPSRWRTNYWTKQIRIRWMVRRSLFLGKIKSFRMAVFTSFDDFQIFFFEIFISFPFPILLCSTFFGNILKNALGNIQRNIFWIVDSSFFWRTFFDFWHFYIYRSTQWYPGLLKNYQILSKRFCKLI